MFLVGKMVHIPKWEFWDVTKEDPRPLVTVSTTVMIVVHFAKVSALYPQVVISMLAKWLEKPPFCHSYTSFGAWPRDHNMPLQRSTMGPMTSFTKVVHSTITLLRFPGVVIVPWPSCTLWACASNYDKFPLIRARHTSHSIPNYWASHSTLDTWRHLLSWGVYSYDSVLSRFDHDKPPQLTDSNHLHYSKPCSNHNI
jgi:hypothetical protein